MKKCDQNEFCHITCALFSDFVKVNDFHSMELTKVKDIKEN